MVQALIAGTKTQTRRFAPIRHGVQLQSYVDRVSVWTGKGDITEYWPSREMIADPLTKEGDRLWVREAWRTNSAFDKTAPRDILEMHGMPFGVAGIFYDVGGDMGVVVENGAVVSRHLGYRSMKKVECRYRAAMHMPRWASRITLLVKDVRIERLNDITEEDALAEGVVKIKDYDFWVLGVDHPNPDFPYLSRVTAREMYAALWDVINGPGAWGRNPWVTVTTFSVEFRNIDDAPS